MQKRILLISILTLSNFAHKSFSMDFNEINPDVLRFFGDAAEGAARLGQNIAEETRRNNEYSYENRERKLKEELQQAKSPEERTEILRQLGVIREGREKKEQTWENVGAQFVQVVPNMLNLAQDVIREKTQAETKLAQEAISSKARKEAIIESMQKLIQAGTDPKNAKLFAFTTTVAAVGVCGAWHGSKVVANLVQQYMNKIPTIAEETSLVSVKDKVVNYLRGQKPETNINDVILESNLATRISRIATSVKNTVSNGGYFRHILFYGPPGTGKTMLAKRIARSSGLEYIYFAGGSALDQLPIEDALSRLVELFEFAKRSSKKLMIIIDEAEVLLADRSKNLSDKTRKLLNLILGYTGTETNNFIIVALTNRPEDLDDAFLSRCDEQIEIGAPAPEQRLEILQSYIKKFLISRTKEQPKPSLFARILGANNPPKPITIAKDALTPEVIEDIAQRLEHFVGRDISKLVISIQSEAYATPQCRITKEIVDRVIQQKIDQKTLEKKQFKQ
ncbi:AAA family ATPase [Candidatus Babela massiliensis]|uniref:ATPase of the AAA+ class n=1 Tax=Candidatus Babela massiliensis TaxID=673862 RepID=V6DIN3_9BACT|nr:AAA family ATPase [Candidatus Babela massiliensis]CDK30386.1 ATPase of the AAA+ class [Candidatus Babela massiliensis]